MQRTRKDINECKEKMDTDRNNDFCECRLCKILNGGGTNSKEHHMSFIINLENLIVDVLISWAVITWTEPLDSMARRQPRVSSVTPVRASVNRLKFLRLWSAPIFLYDEPRWLQGWVYDSRVSLYGSRLSLCAYRVSFFKYWKSRHN